MWLTQHDYVIEALGRITTPTIVIAGDDDAVTLDHTRNEQGHLAAALLR
jgi:hypothetical protein